MKKKKITKEDLKKARLEAFMRHIGETFKQRRVEYKKPLTLVVDKGGQYLTDRKKGDRLKTYVILGWVANNEMKELILAFEDGAEAKAFAKEFERRYINTRVYQPVKL